MSFFHLQRYLRHIRMKQIPTKLYSLLLILALFSSVSLTSCTNSGSSEAGNVREAKGGRFYGGVFNVNETEYFRTLFPLNIVDVYSYRIASQVYEGLFKLDPKTLRVTNSLAESYELSDDRKTYTIRLKKGVFFHNDAAFPDGKGREFVAEDVKYCLTRLATQSRDNQGFHVIGGVIKGAVAYYDATASGATPSQEIEGINIIDKHTIEITLEKPNALFLNYLARPETYIFPKEAYEKYGVDMGGKAIGTGAFLLDDIEEDISVILKRNDNYHGIDEAGNRLPYLDAVKVYFIKDKKTELFEFRKNKLDMVYRLPTDYIIDIIDEYQRADGSLPFELEHEPEMQTQILTFMTDDEIFKNVDIRKAFSFAINKDEIFEYVLGGEAYEAGHHGITPPSFKDKGYPDDIYGYEYNPDSARYYFNKAGYRSATDFPKITLELNAEGDRNTNVAVEIKKDLKDVLGVEVELNIVPMAQSTDKMMTGNFQLIKLSWIADFPSPEAFIRMFYGKDVPSTVGTVSYPNLSRYQNPEFDALYDKAMNAVNEEEAIKYFAQAENLAMRDAPVIVLWYDEGYRLLQPYVKNFPNNPMQYRDFSQVYLEPKATGNPNDAQANK